MAPTVKQAPIAVQRPSMSATDKYKSYVQSNSNRLHQFDDNMKEPNKNHDFKDLIINNDKILRGNHNFNNDAPQFFTCYTSYSCTPTGVPCVQTSQKVIESPQKPVQGDQVERLVRVDPNNNQLITVERSKPGLNVQFSNVNNIQLATQSNQIKPLESSFHQSVMSHMDPINELKNSECGKPAPNSQLMNTKNIPRIPSPLIMLHDATNQKPPRQRNKSGPSVSDRPQGPYGLAHSSSSPVIPSKGSSSLFQDEGIVLHYFQNPHTYKNLQERQLPGQGPIPKSMLPPPAPPADKSKSISPCNSFTEGPSSVPNIKSENGKSSVLEEVHISDKHQGQCGLAHSSSSPAISSKGSSPSQNKSLVLQYFENSHTHNNLQERQLPDRGPVTKSMLPPPAPPSARRKPNSPCNSFNEKRRSLPNATMSGNGKSNDWEKVLTKLYHW